MINRFWALGRILGNALTPTFSTLPQAWPPVIEADGRWTGLYDAQAEGLDVLDSVDKAVDWANRLIEAIDDSR